MPLSHKNATVIAGFAVVVWLIHQVKPNLRSIHGLRSCGLLEGEKEVGLSSDRRCGHFRRMLRSGSDAVISFALIFHNKKTNKEI
jgi:hypothetical protein